MKRRILIALAMLILASPGIALFNSCSAETPQAAPKAAIIDQLYLLQPNRAFIDQTTAILVKSGFQVDVYRGDEITVDFYHRLPSLGYGVILFRSHSGFQTGTIHQDSATVPIRRTYLFTNQLYSENSQVFQQLSDRLAKVRIDDEHPWLFGITANFVRHSMQGGFDRTFIINMGCSTLYIDDMARAFVEKGASVYIGWDASVGLDYVDYATLTLLEKLFSEQKSIETAVKDTMQEKSADPNWGAVLKFYPVILGQKTLAEVFGP